MVCQTTVQCWVRLPAAPAPGVLPLRKLGLGSTRRCGSLCMSNLGHSRTHRARLSLWRSKTWKFIGWWSYAFSLPENLPFGEHVARVITAQLHRAFYPRQYKPMGQATARRANGPKLFIGAFAVEEHLPFAKLTPEGKPVNRPP